MSDEKILVTIFHCDKCGCDIQYVGTDPHTEHEMYCGYCGNKGSKGKKKENFYSYDDFYMIRLKPKQMY